MSTEPNELRIADVVTFLTVRRHATITVAARELRVTPSQVSKAVMRLETFVRAKLLARKGRGVVLTEAAAELLPRLEELVENARILQRGRAADTLLTVAAPSYLATAFFPIVASAVTAGENDNTVRLRGIEAGPAFLRAFAGEDMFQLALTLAAEALPRSWVSTKVGLVHQSLFTSPKIARELGRRPTVARICEVPFVLPVLNTNAQILPGDDGCPIPRAERIAGHEAATAAVAAELAAASDQIVFGPEITARPLVREGRLVEIRLPEVTRRDDLYLHVNADRVLARTQRAVIAALERAMTDS